MKKLAPVQSVTPGKFRHAAKTSLDSRILLPTTSDSTLSLSQNHTYISPTRLNAKPHAIVGKVSVNRDINNERDTIKTLSTRREKSFIYDFKYPTFHSDVSLSALEINKEPSYRNEFRFKKTNSMLPKIENSQINSYIEALNSHEDMLKDYLRPPQEEAAYNEFTKFHQEFEKKKADALQMSRIIGSKIEKFAPTLSVDLDPELEEIRKFKNRTIDHRTSRKKRLEPLKSPRDLGNSRVSMKEAIDELLERVNRMYPIPESTDDLNAATLQKEPSLQKKPSVDPEVKSEVSKDLNKSSFGVTAMKKADSKNQKAEKNGDASPLGTKTTSELDGSKTNRSVVDSTAEKQRRPMNKEIARKFCKVLRKISLVLEMTRLSYDEVSNFLMLSIFYKRNDVILDLHE